MFAVSVWNGGGFYIEVFGRKSVSVSCILVTSANWSIRFERELEALRKELAEVNARSERSSPTLGPQSDDDLTTVATSPNLSQKTLSPSVTEVELPQETIPPQQAENGNAH